MPQVNVRAAAQDAAVTKDHPCLLWRTTSSTVYSSQLGSRCAAYMMHVPPAAADALRKSRLGRCCHSARKVVVLSPDMHIPQLSASSAMPSMRKMEVDAMLHAQSCPEDCLHTCIES